MKLIRSVVLATVLTLLGTAPTLAQTGHDLFQQALVKERSDGDLRGAIAIYERIAREFAADRALAAKALVQMGRCHEKLGNEDAQRAYRRVVQEYPDQTDMASEARTRLSMLQRTATRSEATGIVLRELGGGGMPPEHGVPSPRGRYLALTDWVTGDIAIRDVTTGESRNLTTTGTWESAMQFGMDPAFSPDGEYVAYEWHHPDSKSYYDVRIVPVDGSGAPRVVCDTTGYYFMGPVWSWDGEHIAVAMYPAATLWGAVDDESKTRLLWVSVRDGSTRLLDTYAPSGYQGISLSPDDRYVVYAVNQRGEPEQHDIHIVATDGSGSHPIVQHAADDRLLGWVPDTDWVLFLSNRSNVWGAWAVEVVNGKPEGEPKLVHAGVGQAGPDGFTLAGDFYYHLTVRWFTTYIAPFDAANGQVDTTAALALPGSAMSPAWSPDETRVAYREEFSDFQGTVDKRLLRVFDVTTREVRELADHLTVGLPRWAPDGMSIVVSAVDESVGRSDYHGGIYQVDVETGNAQLLRSLRSIPAWWNGTAGLISADGQSLLYLLRGVEGQGDEQGKDGVIMRRDLATGAEQELYRDPYLVGEPFALSPNGNQLVFALEGLSEDSDGVPAGEGARLMLLHLATGRVRQLAQVEGLWDFELVVWANDGQSVIYPELTDSREDLSLWRVDVESGNSEKVLDMPSWGGVISPDGSRIAYVTGGTSAKSMVMENLKAALER
jgi:Tol biopolymer transport system component